MNWKTPAIIVLAVLAAFIVLYPFLPVDDEVDATWSGTQRIEDSSMGTYLYKTKTVVNVGDEPFHIEMNDWMAVIDNELYMPNAFASYVNGFAECDIEPGYKYTFTLVYEVPKGTDLDSCYSRYVGDKNVEYRAPES